MKKYMLMIVMIAGVAAVAGAGELKKEYFGATKQGAWATYTLEASDGTKSESSSQRNADEDGHVVVEESVKITAGVGVGTESKNTYMLPKKFNISADWLSYGKFTEKMTMKYGTMVMPVNDTTLAAIKKGSKDYRGSMTFEAVEKIDGHMCDRYAYSVVIAGPAPGKETGQLWLDATVPFGIVRQVAKSSNADGTTSSFEIKLQEIGAVQLNTADVVPPVENIPAAPAVVSLIDGYTAGRIGLEVTVEKGSEGKHLQLAFINKTDKELTVKLAAGALEIPASSPIGTLKIVVKKAVDVVVPAEAMAESITVDQQPGRGAFEGKFELSVYEGTQLYSGSVTKATVAK